MKFSVFPLRHLSIRVPWHDSGWNGTVCKCPKRNNACIKLVNIAEKKDEDAEEAIAGASLRDLDSKRFPPCVKERATFMADFAFERLHDHPYVETSPETHSHFRSTPLYYPAFGAAALPFRWMNKKFVWGDPEKGVRGLTEDFPLSGLDPSVEPDLSFQSK